MARRGRGRRMARKPGDLVWTVVENDNFSIATGVTIGGSDIVADTDWTVISGQERATIMRVRGWFSFTVGPAAVLTSAGSVFVYIGLFDADESAPSASDADSYVDEDILATYGHNFPYSNISQTSPDSWSEVVDIKAMRRIRTGQDLRFVITNEHSLSVEVSFVIRALLKKS